MTAPNSRACNDCLNEKAPQVTVGLFHIWEPQDPAVPHALAKPSEESETLDKVKQSRSA
jgi:hypothetical protein